MKGEDASKKKDEVLVAEIKEGEDEQQAMMRLMGFGGGTPVESHGGESQEHSGGKDPVKGKSVNS